MNMSYMMDDEIKSQVGIIKNLIDEFFINYCIKIDIPLKFKQIKIIASGSSFNAAYFGKYFFENTAQTETSIDYASEFINSKFSDFDTKDTLYILISQSGNSKDTVLAMEKLKNKGAVTLCITNNKESIMYQKCDYKIFINAGIEKAIAATKTFSASVFILWLLALKKAQNNPDFSNDEIKNIYSIPSSLNNIFENIENFDMAQKILSKQKDFSIIGLGELYPLCREMALKIKEINYINATAYPMGEFIHGHYAILNKSKVLVIFLIGEKSEFELSTIQKILNSYKTKTILVSDEYLDLNCDTLVKIPSCQSKIALLLTAIIFIQLLAMKIAIKLKRDVDKPKGLQKIVK